MRSDRDAGARFLDHTADVGFEVEGVTLGSLLEGAVLGLAVLLMGRTLPAGRAFRTVEATGVEPALLLRNLLREVLFLHASEGFVPAEASVSALEEDCDSGVLRATVRLTECESSASPETELKGVTLHGLVAEPRDGGGWYGRVIFDV